MDEISIESDGWFSDCLCVMINTPPPSPNQSWTWANLDRLSVTDCCGSDATSCLGWDNQWLHACFCFFCLFFLLLHVLNIWSCPLRVLLGVRRGLHASLMCVWMKSISWNSSKSWKLGKRCQDFCLFLFYFVGNIFLKGEYSTNIQDLAMQPKKWEHVCLKKNITQLVICDFV